MHVGCRRKLRNLADVSVLKDHDSRWVAVNLQGAVNAVVDDVSDEVGRSAEDRLRAHRARCGVEAAIAKDADVVHGAVGFETVVVHVRDIVVVNVDRYGHVVPWRVGIIVRHTVSRMIDRVVKSSDEVVRDHVPLAIDGDGIVGPEPAFLFEARDGVPGRARHPAHLRVEIVAADHNVVCDIEAARSGIVAMHSNADVLEA